MRPIKTDRCNAVYKGDGADIIDVHAEVVEELESASSFDGAREIRVYWQLDDEERERVAAGENIRVHMLYGVAPHWLMVVDAQEVEVD